MLDSPALADFFGALRARVYDDEVRKWVAETGVENVSKQLVNSKSGPPTFQQPKMTLDVLLHYGNMLVKEQENVKRVQLADIYLDSAALGDANKDAMEQGKFFEGESGAPLLFPLSDPTPARCRGGPLAGGHPPRAISTLTPRGPPPARCRPGSSGGPAPSSFVQSQSHCSWRICVLSSGRCGSLVLGFAWSSGWLGRFRGGRARVTLLHQVPMLVVQIAPVTVQAKPAFLCDLPLPNVTVQVGMPSKSAFRCQLAVRTLKPSILIPP